MATKKTEKKPANDEALKLEGPTDEALLQALYQSKSQRVEQLEIDVARLTLMLQELGQKLAKALEK